VASSFPGRAPPDRKEVGSAALCSLHWSLPLANSLPAKTRGRVALSKGLHSSAEPIRPGLAPGVQGRSGHPVVAESSPDWYDERTSIACTWLRCLQSQKLKHRNRGRTKCGLTTALMANQPARRMPFSAGRKAWHGDDPRTFRGSFRLSGFEAKPDDPVVAGHHTARYNERASHRFAAAARLVPYLVLPRPSATPIVSAKAIHLEPASRGGDLCAHCYCRSTTRPTQEPNFPSQRKIDHGPRALRRSAPRDRGSA
jgi:hypothetical protein